MSFVLVIIGCTQISVEIMRDTYLIGNAYQLIELLELVRDVLLGQLATITFGERRPEPLLMLGYDIKWACASASFIVVSRNSDLRDRSQALLDRL